MSKYVNVRDEVLQGIAEEAVDNINKNWGHILTHISPEENALFADNLQKTLRRCLSGRNSKHRQWAEGIVKDFIKRHAVKCRNTMEESVLQ